MPSRIFRNQRGLLLRYLANQRTHSAFAKKDCGTRQVWYPSPFRTASDNCAVLADGRSLRDCALPCSREIISPRTW